MLDDAVATLRPDIYRDTTAGTALGVVEKPLTGWERLGNVGAARKLALLLVLALVWEGYARWLDNPLLFPTFTATIAAFVDGIVKGALPQCLA